MSFFKLCFLFSRSRLTILSSVYRTLKYLAKHLNKISHHHKNTGMTDRNLAIVWAPNLLRSPALETGGKCTYRMILPFLVMGCPLRLNKTPLTQSLFDFSSPLSAFGLSYSHTLSNKTYSPKPTQQQQQRRRNILLHTCRRLHFRCSRSAWRWRSGRRHRVSDHQLRPNLRLDGRVRSLRIIAVRFAHRHGESAADGAT